MKKSKYLISALLMLIIVGLASCIELGEGTDTSKDSQYTKDIVGRWRKASESDYNASGNYLYYVYQADGWGYTWDEGDDFTEQETLDNYHGNGWFEWSIYSGTLTEVHHFKSSSAITTKKYKIKQLTDTRLTKYDEVGAKSQILTKVND